MLQRWFKIDIDIMLLNITNLSTINWLVLASEGAVDRQKREKRVKKKKDWLSLSLDIYNELLILIKKFLQCWLFNSASTSQIDFWSRCRSCHAYEHYPCKKNIKKRLGKIKSNKIYLLKLKIWLKSFHFNRFLITFFTWVNITRRLYEFIESCKSLICIVFCYVRTSVCISIISIEKNTEKF